MNRAEATWLGLIQKRGDAVQGSRVLVACSGGGDSTALLVFLHSMRRSLDLDLLVAHADHGLREDAEKDAAFVRDLSRQLDLDFVEARLDVRSHAARSGLGLETAARELRWGWLRAEAHSSGCDFIATGHTLDDHSETVFLRLARGGGSGALCPLPAIQDLRWSPLIQVHRRELRGYLQAKGLSWMEDPTNAEPFTPRNRWRKLLAVLREEAPNLDEALWETHLQVVEMRELRDARVESLRRDGRWSLDEAGKAIHLKKGLWGEGDLLWVLDHALQEAHLPREPEALRALANWLKGHLPRLRSSKGHGHWRIEPEPGGLSLHWSR